MKLILLVLTEEDLKALKAVEANLKANKPEAVWILHSPHLGVSGPDVTRGIDQELAALDAEMAASATRKDFLRAQELKEMIDSKRIQRDTLLRSGYKNLPQEQVQQIHDKLFAAFFTGELGSRVDITALAEPYDRDEVLEMLLQIKGAWNKDFPHGSYILAWPESLSFNGMAQLTVPPPVETPRERREAELRASRYKGVMNVSKKLGLPVDGVDYETMIQAILEKEAL
jgi:hypothetical protein